MVIMTHFLNFIHFYPSDIRSVVLIYIKDRLERSAFCTRIIICYFVGDRVGGTCLLLPFYTNFWSFKDTANNFVVVVVVLF